jgi:hypothetical protein
MGFVTVNLHRPTLSARCIAATQKEQSPTPGAYTDPFFGST